MTASAKWFEGRKKSGCQFVSKLELFVIYCDAVRKKILFTLERAKLFFARLTGARVSVHVHVMHAAGKYSR